MVTHNDVIADIASKITMTSAGGAVIFGLSAHEFAALVGAFIAFIGLLVNIYFKHLSRRDLLEHHKRIEEKINGFPE